MEIVRLAAELIIGTLGFLGNVVLALTLMRLPTGWHLFSLQLVIPITMLDLINAGMVILKAIMSCMCTILIAAVSASRYGHVVHSRPIKCRYGWPVVSVLCMLIACILALAITKDGFIPDSTMTYCRIEEGGPLRKLAYQASSATIISGLSIVTFCYLGIYLKCRSVLNVLPGRFLFILLAYYFCWMPKFIRIVWELSTPAISVPTPLVILVPLCLNCIHFVGPCLIISFQSSLRKELASLVSQLSSHSDHVELNSVFPSKLIEP